MNRFMNQDTWATLFLRNRHLLVLSIVVILVAGLSALLSLPRLEDPRIVHRNPLIITLFPGASAERVEALVTEKLEDRLQEISEIKDLESTSRAGVSIISVELVDSVHAGNNQEIFSKVRDAIADAAPRLPARALPPIFDDKRDPSAFTVILGVTWQAESEPELGILNRTAEELADRLRNVQGTELVRIFGEPEEEITVAVDHAELTALGLSARDVARSLAAADSKVPAGILRGPRADLLLEVAGELDSSTRVASVPLREGSAGSVIRIGDLAEVRREWRNPPAEIGLVDGSRSVFVAARMKPELRIDRWAERARAVVEEFRSRLGAGVTIDLVFEQSAYTNSRLLELGVNLIAGAGVVVFVVFLMMGWRSALVVGAALPLTVSLTLFGLQVTGNALHQISIYGMIVALGLLIDNAIVVTDEVNKQMRAGRSRLEAVAETVRHLSLPLLASTLTTVLAFAPVLLLPGSVGDFVSSIGGSVIMALVFSLLVSMTIVVTLASLAAEQSESTGRRTWWRDGAGSDRLTGYYRRGLRLALRLPVAAMLLAAFLPAAGFVVARSLGNEFFPPIDRNMFGLQLWMPSQSSIENTRRQASAIEQALREEAEIERVFWLVGGSFPTVFYNLVMNQDDSPHYAQAIITTGTSDGAKRLIPRLQRRLDREFPGTQIVVRQFGQGPPVQADVQYRLYGPSIERLQELGERMRLELQQHPDVLHTQVSMPRGEPKLWLEADEDEARLAGLSLTDLSEQLLANLEGGTGGSVLEHVEEMPVRIRYTDSRRADLSQIASTGLVRAGQRDWIPLSAVAAFDLRPELGGITRFDGLRTNIVKGYTRNGALPIDVAHDVLDRLEREGFELPAGYRIELGGAVETNDEAMANLMTYVPVLATLIVAILVLSFRSFRIAMLLGVVALLSLGLGLLSTWTIQFPISFNTILGSLGLMGVAFNDSIVVLAAIRSNPQAARGNPRAIAEEIIGATRHVVSTTLTTIGGFLPLLLFVGGDFWPGLAIVLAGGVGGAMILALLLVPAAYLLMHRRSRTSEGAVIDLLETETVVEGGAA